MNPHEAPDTTAELQKRTKIEKLEPSCIIVEVLPMKKKLLEKGFEHTFLAAALRRYVFPTSRQGLGYYLLEINMNLLRSSHANSSFVLCSCFTCIFRLLHDLTETLSRYIRLDLLSAVCGTRNEVACWRSSKLGQGQDLLSHNSLSSTFRTDLYLWLPKSLILPR